MIWRRTLIDPVYRADVTIVVASIDDFRPWIEARYQDEEFADLRDASVAGRTLQHDGPTYTEWTLWVPPRAALDTIAHESFHLSVCVLRDRNLDLSADSEEAYAYYFEAVFRQLRQAVTDATAAAGRRRRGKKGRAKRRRQ